MTMAEKKTPEKAENKPETTFVTIPRERGNQEDKVVWVNSKRYIIKRGVQVEVPISVAKVLEHEQRMLDKIFEFETKNAQ